MSITKQEKEIISITKQEKEIFDFLNALRETGVTNMFGATPYIIDKFNIPRKLASSTLSKWMELFNENGYEHLTITN